MSHDPHDPHASHSPRPDPTSRPVAVEEESTEDYRYYSSRGRTFKLILLTLAVLLLGCLCGSALTRFFWKPSPPEAEPNITVTVDVSAPPADNPATETTGTAPEAAPPVDNPPAEQPQQPPANNPPVVVAPPAPPAPPPPAQPQAINLTLACQEQHNMSYWKVLTDPAAQFVRCVASPNDEAGDFTLDLNRYCAAHFGSVGLTQAEATNWNDPYSWRCRAP